MYISRFSEQCSGVRLTRDLMYWFMYNHVTLHRDESLGV
jgi:hypothetical protein